LSSFFSSFITSKPIERDETSRSAPSSSFSSMRCVTSSRSCMEIARF